MTDEETKISPFLHFQGLGWRDGYPRGLLPPWRTENKKSPAPHDAGENKCYEPQYLLSGKSLLTSQQA